MNLNFIENIIFLRILKIFLYLHTGGYVFRMYKYKSTFENWNYNNSRVYGFSYK